MRVPRRGGFEKLRTVVRMRQSSYDLDRPSDSHDGRFGSNDSGSSTVSGVEMWVYSPNENNLDTPYGDRIGGSLQALALPGIDVKIDDRLTHGAQTYEVDAYEQLPNDDDPQLMLIGLNRVVN